MIRILVLCNSGMSSSNIIKMIRGEFKEKGIDTDIVARSVAELKSIIEFTDVILLAPHLKFKEMEVRELCSKNNKPYMLISPAFYGFQEDARISDEILKTIQNKVQE